MPDPDLVALCAHDHRKPERRHGAGLEQASAIDGRSLFPGCLVF